MICPVPMRFDDPPLLWVIDDVYQPQECQALIDQIERRSSTLATNNPIYRDQDRMIVDDVCFAQDLLIRLRPHLPTNMGELTLDRLNDHLRMYRYQRGQRFAPHMDHWYQPDDQHISLLTVLIYLNDDFGGGETRFMEQLEQVVTPRTGSVAVFQHKIRHEGCPMVWGSKYAIRSDVIYRAPYPIQLTFA